MNNRKVLVTGASGEIGTATVKRLAKDGFDIIAQYNSTYPSEAERFANEYTVNFSAIKADLSKSDEINKLIKSSFGVDTIVNCAGVSYVGLITDITSDEAKRLLNINLNSAIEITSQLLPSMISKKFGRIVNISSIWGVYGASCEVHYSASKAGLIGFTKALAKEVGLSGITVNAVAPGFVQTKMNDHLTDEEKADFISSTVLGRAISTDEVASVVSFLCSTEASALTGQTIIAGETV